MIAKLFILHENSEWIEPLVQRLTEEGIIHEEWDLSKGVIDLSEEPPIGVFYSRMSASSHTRGHGDTPGFGMAVLCWLEQHGRIIVNGKSALSIELSKAEQSIMLQKHGIQTPKTIAVLGKTKLISAAKLHFSTQPFISKDNRGGKGIGVRLFNSIKDFTEYVESPDFERPYDGITILQQYIQSPDKFITRIEFINKIPIYSMRVDTSLGFQLCPAEGCLVPNKFNISCTPQAPDCLIKSYQQFLMDNNIDIAGIEFISDSGGSIFTYDINTTTNYNQSAEQVAGSVSGIESQINYFKELLLLLQ